MRLLLSLLLALPLCATAQVSGNAAFGNERAANSVVLPRSGPLPQPPPPDLAFKDNDSTMALHAFVLINAPADRFVATFSISESAPTVQEATGRVEAKTTAFLSAVERDVLSVSIDPVTQVELFAFEFETEGGRSIAQEVRDGFEVQRNVLVAYESSDQISALAVAAAEAGIHDLARVEYVTDDVASVRDELFREAAAVLDIKRERVARLGVPISERPVTVEVERFATVEPPDLYARYEAFEAATIDVEFPYGRNTAQTLELRRERKPTTYFWRPLDEAGFDRVVRPGPTEPVVQHTLLLTVRYSVE